jgi:hypothetical protein
MPHDNTPSERKRKKGRGSNSHLHFSGMFVPFVIAFVFVPIPELADVAA